MLIRIGYDIALRLSDPTAVIYVLHVHPSRKGDLLKAENFRIEPDLPVEEYTDGFGNLCGRVNCPAGVIRFLNDATVRDPGELDAYVPDAPQHDVRDLPVETLSFLLPSRYCEVDSELLDFAWQNLWQHAPGMAAGCRRFATSSTVISASIICRLEPIAPLWKAFAKRSASAAILRIWQSLCAGA